MKKERVIVVTGGGSGMGRAIARRFAEAGDKVYILGRREEKLKETAEGFSSIHPLVADVTDIKSISAAKNKISKESKTVHVLVNNAGGNVSVSPEADLTEAASAWDQIVTVNLSSVFYVTTAFSPMLVRPGGRVINITSLAAFAGSSLGGVSGQAYAAAKSGVHGLSRTLTKMLAPQGITVNCIAPGVIDETEFFRGGGVPDERRGMYLAAIPLKRFGKPEEIAEGAFYLASERAGFVTGEILNINGGGQFGR